MPRAPTCSVMLARGQFCRSVNCRYVSRSTKLTLSNFSHSGPPKPGRHWHTGRLPWSTQLAPFWHSVPSQGLLGAAGRGGVSQSGPLRGRGRRSGRAGRGARGHLPPPGLGETLSILGNQTLKATTENAPNGPFPERTKIQEGGEDHRCHPALTVRSGKPAESARAQLAR